MSKKHTKRKRSKFDHKIFEKARGVLEHLYPQIPRRGFFISNLDKAKILPGKMASVAVSAVCEIVGNSLTLRAYRRPKESSDLMYKIDEIRDVNKEISETPPPQDIENHHMKHNVPEDMMSRNQMIFEFVSDANGELKPNVQPDGMIKTYINFPDPMEEIRKKYGIRRPIKDD